MGNALLAEERLNEAVNLISNTTVLAIFYTPVFILYCLSIRLSYTNLRNDYGNIKRQTACTLVLVTVLMICATLDVIIRNRIAQLSYIDNSNLSGGPLGLSAALRTARLALLDSIVNVLENLLISGVLLSRVRIIWSGTRFTIPLIIVSLFLYLASAGLTILYNAITSNNDSSNLAATPQAEGIIFIMASVISLASLVFMASAIIARLLFIRQKHIKLMGKSDTAGQYLGIATMFIESYALDAFWSIGSLISFGVKYAPTMYLFAACTTQVDILTNFLLIYRILSGQAWDRQTQNHFSTLNWDHNGTSMAISGTVDLLQTNVVEEDAPVTSSRDRV